MPFVPADTIEQPHGNAIMEELTSDLQMRDSVRPLVIVFLIGAPFFLSQFFTGSRRQPTLYRPAAAWFHREGGTYHFLGCSG
jgi:hypothetical protein